MHQGPGRRLPSYPHLPPNVALLVSRALPTVAAEGRGMVVLGVRIAMYVTPAPPRRCFLSDSMYVTPAPPRRESHARIRVLLGCLETPLRESSREENQLR